MNNMKHKTLLFTILIFLLSSVDSNAQYFCIANTSFQVPDIALHLFEETSYITQFTVKGFTPQNIKITPVDSISKSFYGLFEKATIENLNKITYLEDAQYRIKIKYVFYPAPKLNTAYAITNSVSEITFAFRASPIEKYYEGCGWPSESESDTVIFKNYINYKNGTIIGTSDIFVERLFDGDVDSTVIIKNNCPEYTEEILKEASTYSKKDFTDVSPKSTKYFITFQILRSIYECESRRTY